MATNNKQLLHWSQRIALFRHNLHTASRSRDFGFFKALQAAAFMGGSNYVAALIEAMNDDADTVLAAMDNLNSGLAYVHQDAYKRVYDFLRDSMRENDGEVDEAKLHVEINMQKNTADMAIDKMTTSAIALVDQQPAHLQEMVAHVWMSGATLVTDCIQVALDELDRLEAQSTDFIRLEQSWNNTRASCECAISGLRGIFNLMDSSTPSPQDSIAMPTSPGRGSIASASGSMFRRLSNAFTSTSTPPPTRRESTVAGGFSPAFNRNNSNTPAGFSPGCGAPVYRTPNYIRNSVSAGCPTSMPSSSFFDQHKLAAIPPSPSPQDDDMTDPFDKAAAHMPGALPDSPMSPLAPELRKLPQVVV